MSTADSQSVWLFANARLDERNRELLVNGVPVAVEEKPLAVLLCLLRAEGELVTKQEIFDSVWSGRVVSDGVLSQAIWRIREVLGDSDKTIVRTVHGHGFRLDVAIEIEGGSDDTGTRLQLDAGAEIPGLVGWHLDERLQTRPSNELWRIRSDSGELGVLKLALDSRAERALKREVTLNKVLLKELGENPPLVPLIEWQFDAAPHWIRMPWYEAGSLADWVKSVGGADTIALQTRVDIVAGAADAFAKAHALGVMHKDIKPGNILVDDSCEPVRLLLCDFGSGTTTSRARLAQAGVTVMGFTQTLAVDAVSGSNANATTGTPAYIAPELLEGHAFSERSDVYSLGVLLYQLVSGRMNRPLATGWEDDVDDLGLREIIRSASAGRPEKRLSGMYEFAQKLRSWIPYEEPRQPSELPDGMRLSAIMFTDMVGYSRLVRADERVARELLDHHIASLRRLLSRHHGREIEIIGDAFMVEFPSAVLAVECAIEFQRAQAAYNNAASPQRQYQIRIGIHIGDVECRDGKMFGHGVNYAARIEPFSPAGGVAVSPAVRDAVSSRLNLPFRSLGRKQLKNVAENIEVFALMPDDMGARDAAATRAGENAVRRRAWRWPPIATAALAGILPLVAIMALAVGGYSVIRSDQADVSVVASNETVSEQEQRVTILPFQLFGLDDQSRQVMTGLQDALASELSGARGWTLVLARNLAATGLVDAPAHQLGEAFRSSRLIRGSVQQIDDQLRINVQIVAARSGEALWAKSLQGRTRDLFDLQQKLGAALSAELGGQVVKAAVPKNVDPVGYEAYLHALSLSRSLLWENENADPKKIQSVFDQLEIAVDRSGHYNPILALAIESESLGCWWSRRSCRDARAAVEEHIARLERQGAEPMELAVARAHEAIYIDDRPDRALELLTPFRADVLENRDTARLYLAVLRGLGRFEDAIAIGNRLVRNQPNDLLTLGWLGADYLDVRQGAAMVETFYEAASRFPKASVLRDYVAKNAYALSGDVRFLDPGMKWPENGAPFSDPAKISFRQLIAYRQGDREEYRRLLLLNPPKDLHWNGGQFYPGSLALAVQLHFLGADAHQVQALAKNGLDALASWREDHDTPSRKINAALAHALLGNDDQARALLAQAMDVQVSTHSRVNATNEAYPIMQVLVLLDDAEALVTFMKEAIPRHGAACGYIGNLYREVLSVPEAQAVFDQECTAIIREQRVAMEPYLAGS